MVMTPWQATSTIYSSISRSHIVLVEDLNLYIENAIYIILFVHLSIYSFTHSSSHSDVEMGMEQCQISHDPTH